VDFEFWNNCWARPTQPFHLIRPHHFLVEHFERYLSPQSSVLLPLCGKTQDLTFLAQNGVKAVGVEFNPEAVSAFFQDNSVKPTITDVENKQLFQGDKIDLWLADFFDISPDDIGLFELIFDRAALIALPDSMRAQYAKHLTHFLADEGTLLLVTMDYDANEMSGPPFLVDEHELHQLFPEATITEIQRQSILESHPRWRELELNHLDEVLYLIKSV